MCKAVIACLDEIKVSKCACLKNCYRSARLTDNDHLTSVVEDGLCNHAIAAGLGILTLTLCIPSAMSVRQTRQWSPAGSHRGCADVGALMKLFNLEGTMLSKLYHNMHPNAQCCCSWLPQERASGLSLVTFPVKYFMAGAC